jgi:hypothetical protein
MKTKTLLTTLIAGALCHFTGCTGWAQNAAPPAAGTKDVAPGEVVRNPRDVIAETIQKEVGRKLKEAGATYDDLQATVAVDRDSATPFKVSYKELRNFKGNDGTTPDPDGKFIMEYVGGGKWEGKLAGTQFSVPVGHTDNIDLPFVNDPQVIGEWKSVDFVADISDFNPDKPNCSGDVLFLKGLTFRKDGKTSKPWWTWTKGVVMHHGDKTASHYEIREIKGQSYLFFEWKSGDVTILGMKPHYYVLAKQTAKDTP